jgi:hypothetical protein
MAIGPDLRPTGVAELDEETLQIILRRTKYAHLNDEQFELLIAECDRRGLDPWMNHLVVDQDEVRVTLAGLRCMAKRTDEYDGQLGPYWCGVDGKWRTAWTSKERPAAARVGIMCRGRARATYRAAHWEVVMESGNAEDEKSDKWDRKDLQRLADHAEELALAATFPPATRRSSFKSDTVSDLNLGARTAKEEVPTMRLITDDDPEPARTAAAVASKSETVSDVNLGSKKKRRVDDGEPLEHVYLRRDRDGYRPFIQVQCRALRGLPCS